MERIEDYSNSKIPLAEREQILFQTVEYLDDESVKLFSKLVDLDVSSIEEIEDTYQRIIELQKLFAKVKEAYDYLMSVEIANYSFAFRRLELKYFLNFLATFYAFKVSPPLGIFSFTALSHLTNTYFMSEKEQIDDALDQYNIDERMNTIRRTLENCCRFFDGKSQLEEEKTKTKEDLKKRKTRLAANSYIILFLAGHLTVEDVHKMPKEIRDMVIQTIKNNGNPNSKSLFELYEILQREEKEKKAYRKKDA